MVAAGVAVGQPVWSAGSGDIAPFAEGSSESRIASEYLIEDIFRSQVRSVRPHDCPKFFVDPKLPEHLRILQRLKHRPIECLRQIRRASSRRLSRRQRSTGQAHSGRAGPPPSKIPRSAASTAEEGTVAHGPTARLAGCALSDDGSHCRPLAGRSAVDSAQVVAGYPTRSIARVWCSIGMTNPIAARAVLTPEFGSCQSIEPGESRSVKRRLHPWQLRACVRRRGRARKSDRPPEPRCVRLPAVHAAPIPSLVRFSRQLRHGIPDSS